MQLSVLSRILLLGFPFALLSLNAQGEEDAADQQAATSQMEEIVVSATRRDESVQDVPLSIQAYSGQQMEVRGMERLENVIGSTPNVVQGGSTNGQTTPQFSMRGIPGAGVFVDGVFQQSFVGIATRNIVELDRVEVLRGPQGTLFGRDTTGGAIRLFTKKPADQFGVRASSTLGSYDRRDLKLNVDLPITDTLKSKLTFANQQREGYLESQLTGRKTGEIDDEIVRLDLVWEPTSSFDARFTFDSVKSRSTAADVTLAVFDPGAPGIDPGLGFQVPMSQFYEAAGGPAFSCQNNVMDCPGGRVGDLETVSSYDGPPGVRVDEENFNLHINYHINDYISVYSLTNYNRFDSWFYVNFDASPVDYFSQGTYAERESWSQELQFSGAVGPVDWVGGVYAWETDVQDRFNRWALWDFDEGGGPNPQFSFSDLRATQFCQNPQPGLVPCVRLPFLQANPYDMEEEREEGFAVFAEVTVNVTRALSLTVGGRYHDQTNKTYELIPAPSTPGLADTPGHLVGTEDSQLRNLGRTNGFKEEFDNDTYRVVLDYQINNDMSVYTSFAQGFNAGGTSRVRLPNLSLDFPYAPENIEAYEIGFRSEWLGGRLRVNPTIFFTDWEDIQLDGTIRDPVTGSVLPVFLTQNAASAEAEGFEVSIQYRPMDRLMLNLDAGYLDTEYTEIAQSASNDLSSGDEFGRAPERQISAGIQWTAPVGSQFELLLRADYAYSSGYHRAYIPGDRSTNFTGDKWEVPSFGLLQARAVFGPVDGRWELALFGLNLTDERYSTGGFMSPLLQIDDGTLGRPRELGVSFSVAF